MYKLLYSLILFLLRMNAAIYSLVSQSSSIRSTLSSTCSVFLLFPSSSDK